MNRRTEVTALGAILAVALLTRLTGLGLHEIWLDEANSILIASRPLSGLIEGLAQDANPPLFYLLLHVWMGLFGDSETAVRLLSVLFGVLLPFSVFIVGKRLLHPMVSLFAATVCALSPIQIYHSQTVRMYTLLPLLGLVTFYFLIRALQEGRRSSWAGYAVLSALTLYTHNWAFFLLPVGWLLILLKPHRHRFRAFLVSQAVVFVLYLPWLPTFVLQNETARYSWIATFAAGTSPLLAIPGSLRIFSIGAGYPAHYMGLGFGDPVLLRLLGILLFLALFALALIPWGRKQHQEGKKTYLLVAYLFVPLVIATLVSLARPLYLVGRYDSLVFPAFCLLVGVGALAAAKWHRLSSAVVVLLLAVMAISSLVPYYQVTPRSQSKETARYLEQHAGADDIVVFLGLSRAPIQYYLQRHAVELELMSFPRSTEDHMGIFNAEELLKRPEQLEFDAVAIRQHALMTLKSTDKLWVVYQPAEAVNAFLRRELQRNFISVEDLSDQRLGVLCYRPLRIAAPDAH